jgi:hypothetical protein
MDVNNANETNAEFFKRVGDLDLADGDTVEHEHQYTIPVEWATEENPHYQFSDTKYWGYRRSVTKLRCVCGNEVDRA